MKKVNIILLLLCFLWACEPNYKNPDETLYLSQIIKEWIVDDTDMLEFDMLGSDSTVMHFKEQDSQLSISSFSATRGGFFESYHVTAFENYRQHFIVGDTLAYYIQMEASRSRDAGNIMNFSFFGYDWGYDVTYDKIRTVNMRDEESFQYKWEHSDPINSSCEILVNIEVNHEMCDSVMHFTLEDFKESFVDETVTEFYYAKHVGLVKFARNDGTVFERVW